MRLFTYVVANDTGFAPNPFFGILTLACCKPRIRQSAEPGDLICGFAPKKRGNGLLYVMEVAEKLSFREYWGDPRFRLKRPDDRRGPVVFKCGDNVYEPNRCDGFRQLPSTHSNGDDEDPDTKKRDLGGQFVLVADRFVYFGRDAIPLPAELNVLIPARGHKCRFSGEIVSAFSKLFNQCPRGVRASPTKWPAADTSWQT